MKAAPTAALLVVALGAATACTPPTDPAPTPTPSESPAKLDPEDPKAGMNTSRPDSIKDLKPEPGADPSP